MNTTVSAFDVCRNYIADHADVMMNEDFQFYLGAIRARDWESIIRKSAELEGFNRNLQDRRIHRQIGAFFKKNVSFRHAGSCEEAANLAFLRGERLCRITNKRLDHFYLHRDRLDPDMQLMVAKAERYISNVLGDFDVFLEEIPFLLKLTAGATALANRQQSIPFLRFKRTIDVGPRAVPYLTTAYRFYGYPEPKVEKVWWNRLATVPKNCRTDRMIACEPTGSIPFQLAFDTYAKRRLRSRGIDLSQQSKNRELALKGSIDGTYCTVDLSMASDTMSRGVVSWLLPLPWHNYLNDLRSTHFSFNGINLPEGDDESLTYGKYAKFSSMGNGATFALETLIFASLAHAAGSKSFSVYGDDIIIEPDYVEDFYRLLRFFGFIPNVEKSFTAGPFRESCGGDFYEGVDITPFYIRSEESWDLPNLSHNINGLAAVSTHGELWKYLAAIVQQRNLPFVPWNENSTTGVFITPYHAYQRKLLRSTREGGPWRLFTLAYSAVSKDVICRDSRSLALWFLRKQVTNSDQGMTDSYDFRLPHWINGEAIATEGVTASRHATSTRRFRRKWVEWHMPNLGVPSYLFGFSDLLIPRKLD